MHDPARATPPYPQQLHRTETADIQVFRRGTDLQIVNASPTSYSDFDLWVNQRYLRRVESLPAGRTVRLSLWDFYDEYGDRFNAGGFFRTHEPMPVRLVQIQPREDAAIVGLITIRREEIRLSAEPGR